MKIKVLIVPRDYYGTPQRCLVYKGLNYFSFESKSYCRYANNNGADISKEIFMAKVKEYESQNNNSR